MDKIHRNRISLLTYYTRISFHLSVEPRIGDVRGPRSWGCGGECIPKQHPSESIEAGNKLGVAATVATPFLRQSAREQRHPFRLPGLPVRRSRDVTGEGRRILRKRCSRSPRMRPPQLPSRRAHLQHIWKWRSNNGRFGASRPVETQSPGSRSAGSNQWIALRSDFARSPWLWDTLRYPPAGL
jgi:hypothetical protein